MPFLQDADERKPVLLQRTLFTREQGNVGSASREPRVKGRDRGIDAAQLHIGLALQRRNQIGACQPLAMKYGDMNSP